MTRVRWSRLGRLGVSLALSGAAVLGCAATSAPAAAGPAAQTAAPATPATAPAVTGPTLVSSTRHPPAPLQVTIRNFTFFPRNLALAVDQRVVIVNRDTVAHTWSAAPHSGWSYDSGNLAPGARATFGGFRRAGRYRLLCLYHAEMPSMTGVVTVR